LYIFLVNKQLILYSLKNTLFKIVPFCLILLVGTVCVEPYDPPVVSVGTNILVIDGSLNTEGISRIRITRTQDLTDKNPVKEELQASVSFEEENGSSYALTEDGNGNYSLPEKAFNLSKNYRLVVNTSDSKEYVSEFVPALKSPEIDSVTWKVTSDKGLQFYVNTHDSENDIRYYSWTYEETWRYIAAFNSRFEWVNRVPTNRLNSIYICYNTKPSQSILIGSAGNLSMPVISNFPLLYIPQNSERIRFKYTILVHQTALTKEAFEYFGQLQKNTENLGTLFDPQPSQLTGNIRCTSDLSEPVIGYFLAGSTVQNRIFISSDFLPRARYYNTSFVDCTADGILQVIDIPMLKDRDLLNMLLVESFPVGAGEVTAYSYTSATCGDCRTAGGTTTVPDFWQ
jgi:hypothetical protein